MNIKKIKTAGATHMYDVILVSTHYNYGDDGTWIPDHDDNDHDDLSMTIPLGIIHVAQYLHDCGFKVRVVHIPHEVNFLRSFRINEDQINKSVQNILKNYQIHAKLLP